MASAPPSEREIIAEFNSRRQRLVDLVRKIEELSGEVNDHDTVIKALTPMESGRRCFRLIGEVLVERTVGETLPAVTRNKLQLEAAVQAMTDTVKTLEKQLADFQAKHKIKLVDKQGRPVESGEEEEDGGEASGSASSKAVSKGGQGVLVS
ncbi:KE2 family protein [Haematococcus lacustris]